MQRIHVLQVLGCNCVDADTTVGDFLPCLAQSAVMLEVELLEPALSQRSLAESEKVRAEEPVRVQISGRRFAAMLEGCLARANP